MRNIFLLPWGKRRSAPMSRPGAVKDLKTLERLIGYRFRDHELIASALRHRSIIAETGEPRSAANERLEFLGDAVLGLLVSEQLYIKYPEAREGFLARLKSLAVSGRQLAAKAKKINLGQFIQISNGEVRNGGRARVSILEDAMEAVIGAIYLDGGIRPVRKFVRRFITDDLNGRLIREKEDNFKSLLLEYSQGRALGTPLYRIVDEQGPDHEKTFFVEVLIGNKMIGTGAGRSKKQAEQQAAKNAASELGILP